MSIQKQNYIPRLIHPPKGSYFLFGPRGTGKSTWLMHHYPEAARIDLLMGEEERRYNSYPERVRNFVEGHAPATAIIIDEVQRAPRLLPEIHHLIEHFPERQFIMTGSSTRKLRRSVSDLLGGRALLRHMGPFLASELGNDRFSLQKALKTGLIPLIWDSTDPEERLRHYLQLYLREEVQAEGLVRQIGDFSRFLEIASFSYGSLWTTADISRESSVKRSTVENYLQILEDLFLAFSLPVFSRRAKRRLVAHKKFYFFDVGIYRMLRPRGILDSDYETEGMAMEGLVAQHLHSWTEAQTDRHTLSFWRTQTGLEVDFVIYGPKGFWALEVKRSANPGPDDVRALAAFKEEYPEANCAIVAPIKKPDSYRGFPILPLEDFLLSVRPDRGLPV